MREEDIDNYTFMLMLAFCAAAIISIMVIVRQRDTIAQQQTRVENFQNMVNSIPADYRTPEGKRLRP